MPYYDEEYPGQPLWQSVLLFCYKGMIEGIMVILFFWLMLLVLFTKQLEVHLQILLLVGLIMFCLCLMLGCVLCWRNRHIDTGDDKEPTTSATDPVSLAQGPPPASAAAVVSQQYEQHGDILVYPSTFSISSPSEDNFASVSFSSHGHVEMKEHPKTYLSLRRLSTPPLNPPVYKPMDHSRTSLPSLPKLGLLSRTRRVLERRCTVTGDSICYDEHSRLTSPSFAPSVFAEEPIPLTMLHYGSDASTSQPASPLNPCLHFTMAFSAEQHTLTVNLLSLTGTLHRLEDVSVLGSLAPLCPCPVQASAPCSLSSETPTLVLVLRVGSVEELQRCLLRLALYTRDLPSLRGMPLGEVEVQCSRRDWNADQIYHCNKELSPNKSLNSQDAPMSKGFSCPPLASISDPGLLHQSHSRQPGQHHSHTVTGPLVKS